MPTLVVKNLVKQYHGRQVVNSVSLTLNSQAVVGLLGPNGAGKTTSFYMIIGMIKPDGGKVLLDDEEITYYPMHQRARRGIGYLPQETSIFSKLSVRENILAILENFKMSASQRRQQSDSLLDELGILHLADSKAGVLSGGECRRLEISRALAAKPIFILLDEPFAGVDPLAVTDIKKIIAHLKERGIGILISDHNVRETLGACDHAYIMNNGEVIEYGTPEEIAASPTARRFYLGQEFKL